MGLPDRPDFEHNLVEFQIDFFELVSETDPNFDLDLLRDNPNPPVEVPPVPDLSEVYYPATKEDLGLPLRLSGPRVVNSDIFGNEVQLEDEVRVKGSVYGRNGVRIGSSCVIEGSVVSGGPLEIETGSRVEGAVIGADIKLTGPVQVEGPIYSRGSLTCKGGLEAQILYATANIILHGDADKDEVRVEAGLIMAKAGNIEIDIPVSLAEVAVQTTQQKFYLGRDEQGELLLLKAVSGLPNQLTSTILTTLTDAELEKLLTELETFERR